MRGRCGVREGGVVCEREGGVVWCEREVCEREREV